MATALWRTFWKRFAGSISPPTATRAMWACVDSAAWAIGTAGFSCSLMVTGSTTMCSGQAFIGSEFPVDIDLIQRIEIIRGPSSSLYGAEAFFAVINVITREKNQPKRAEISFAAGSFGSYSGRAT